MDFIEQLKLKAKSNKQRIVLPEGEEERTLRAADMILSQGFAEIILIGDPEEISVNANKFQLSNISKATIIDPLNHDKVDEYVDMMVELRKSKGLTKEQAAELIKKPLYLSVMMIKAGDADGEVAGAMNSTGDVLRPAFQFVKTMPGISVVSGFCRWCSTS